MTTKGIGSHNQAGSLQALPQGTLPVASPSGDNPFPAAVAIDNNILAALIAAENAALIMPQYLISLPIIQR